MRLIIYLLIIALFSSFFGAAGAVIAMLKFWSVPTGLGFDYGPVMAIFGLCLAVAAGLTIFLIRRIETTNI